MMKPEIRDMWADALESEEYRDKQCKRALTRVNEDGSEGHCCLGVLTELAVKAGVIKRSTEEARGFGVPDGSIAYADTNGAEALVTPEKVVAWAGLDRSNPHVEYDGRVFAIANLNDGVSGEGDDFEALTFPEIAKIIREQL